MKKLHFVSASLLLVSTFAACEQSSDESDLGMGLRALSVVSDANVRGFNYFIAPCGQSQPEIGHFEALRNQALPGNVIDVLGDPFADDSSHRFADYFKTVAAGCYQVKAVPVYADGGVMKPYSSCSSPTREVQVTRHGTSETVLLSQCLGTDPGAIDAVAALNHDPELLNVRFPDSKFSCGETIKLCAQAKDVDQDPLEYVVTFPQGSSCFSEGFHTEGNEMCTLVYCNDGGTYEPTVTVFDLAVDPDNGAKVRMESLLERYGTSGLDPDGNPWTSRSELQAIIHVDACPPPAGCVGHENGGSRYLFCDDLSTWDDAQSKCRAEGGYLAAIESAEENAFIASKLPSGFSWIGATDTAEEKVWRWTDGRIFWNDNVSTMYSNWAGGEPNNWSNGAETENCGHLGWSGHPVGTWNDYWCTAKFRYICEIR